MSRQMSPSDEGLTRDLQGARDSYKLQDADASRAAHATKKLQSSSSDSSDETRGTKKHSAANEQHKSVFGDFIKPMVFGGVDGLVTTFAVISSSTGARLSLSTTIILGLANLLADGLSMGIGDYLSSKAEIDYAMAERKREMWETENYLEGEKQEMVEIYERRGMSHADAVTVIDAMSKYPEIFVDAMLVDELGIQPPDQSAQPWKSGVVMFGAFCLAGLVPLLAYIVAYATNPNAPNYGGSATFAVACALTAVALFVLGAVKSVLTSHAWWRSGLTVLVTGGIAAAAAYAIGAILEPVLGQ